MYLILNVGSTGTGKSHLITNEFVNKERKILLYDYQNEYSTLPWYDPKDLRPQMRFFKNINAFVEIWPTLPKGYNVVVEEATGCFKGQTGKDVIEFILSKRHVKLNFICNFHSLHRVPMDLMEFADIIFLRKTGDLQMNVKKKYPEYFDLWKKIKTDGDPYAFEMLKVSNLTR